MSTTLRKASGIDVTILDLGPHADFMTWGGIVLPHGGIYMICSEGVAWRMNKRSDFELQSQWGFNNVEQLRDAINNGSAKMDVAHLVRIFGARLDSNLSQFIWTVNNEERAAEKMEIGTDSNIVLCTCDECEGRI
jgi:hypothetical protein